MSNEELKKLIQKLNDTIIQKEGTGYAAGYFESFLYDIVVRLVPLERRQEVVDDIQFHLDANTNKVEH